jgi:Ca-activated chloride channel family protein
MNLEHRDALWLIPVSLIFLLGLGVWGWRAKRKLARLFRVDLDRLKKKQVAKLVAAGIVMALLAAALASPRLPFSVAPAPNKTGEVALLVDVSKSMAARRDPSAPSILDRTKPLLREIVDHMQELGGVKMGLYGFTNMARSHVPFVGRQDYPYLKATIDKVLDINSTPGSGSGFGRPILDVASKFSKEAKIKLIVLFSDGEAFVGVSRGVQDTERGLFEQAMTRARLDGIKVITVGVGEPKGAKIPLYRTDGAFTGEYARLHDADLYFYLRTERLKEIASRTGGRYYDENDRQALIGFIKENLDSAPYEEIAGKTTEYRSIAGWFILACLPIWAILARRFLMR